MKVIRLALVLVVLFGNSVKGHGNHHVRSRHATESGGTPLMHAKQQGNDPGRCRTTATDSDVQGINIAKAFAQIKLTAAKSDNSMIPNIPPKEDENPQAILPRPSKKKILIPICFHVIGKRISRWQLKKNLDALNKGYSGDSCCDPSQSWCVPGTCSPETGIRFVMARLVLKKLRGTTKSPTRLFACVKRNPNEVNMEDAKVEKEIKESMHMGDGRILNVYITTLIDWNGWATFPTRLQSKPKMDGVVVGKHSLVGSDSELYNEGDTLVHEIGHWIGVFHPFQSGCSPGDGVDDTPNEAWPNWGCDPSEKRDTCPEAGLDPIHNFMDYSDDICVYEWTQGQIDVMHVSMDFYRSQSTPELLPVQLTDSVWTEKYTMAKSFARLFYMDAPTNSLVFCQTTANNGNLNLSVGKTVDVTAAQCKSQESTSNEMCSSLTDSGKVYAWVDSSITTIDFQVRCSIVESGELPAPRDITDGERISLSLGAGSTSQLFLRNVPPYSRVACSTVGIGDVDLLIIYDASYNAARCSSAVPGSPNEGCVTEFTTSAIDVEIAIYASMASNVNLVCSITSPTELIGGAISDPYSLAKDDVMMFYSKVTTLSDVVCTTDADNGNIYLEASWGYPQNWKLYCYSEDPNSESSQESCSPGTATGIVYVTVSAYLASVSDFTVQCVPSADLTIAKGATQLTSGTATTPPVDIAPGDILYFYLNEPTATQVTCTTTVTNGSVDLYMAWSDANVPTCQARGSSANCALGAGGGKTFAIVFAKSATTGFTITCTATLP